MNPNRPIPPRDDEIDALLARQYRDTTPEFEARWVDLKRELRTASAGRRRPSWAVWLGLLATGSIVAVVLMTSTIRPPKAPPGLTMAEMPVMAELLAMDEVLGQGRVLLDGENRDALLHLSAQSQPAN